MTLMARMAQPSSLSLVGATPAYHSDGETEAQRGSSLGQAGKGLKTQDVNESQSRD